MFRIAKNAMAALALTGLVLSQPALAVRSSESLPAPGMKMSGVARVGSPVKKSESIVGIPLVAILITLGVIVTTIIIVKKDNNNGNQSPG
jgi:hypothetical protein